MDLSVVLPIYNSAPFLSERLRALASFLDTLNIRYEIIPVDDGSSDASPEILSKLSIPNCSPIILTKNRGKFGALAAGMEKSRGDCCIFTDADIPYELSVIPYMDRLVRENGFHIVIGDRTLPGSRYRIDLSIIRKVTTSLFTFFVRVFVTGGLFDTQCGMKAFRGDVARAMFPLLREHGFAGDVELLYIALKYNLSVRRVPARLQFQGESTVHPVRDGMSMLRALLKIRARHRSGLYQSDDLTKIAAQDYWSAAR